MPDKRVIMFVIPQLGTGGSERLVLDIARRLDKKRFKPIILTLGSEPTLPFKIDDENIEIIVVEKKVKGVDIGLMFRIWRTMREKEVEVVNTHHTFSLIYAFLGAKLLGHKRLYHTVHSSWEIEANARLWKFVEGFMLRFADGAIAVSEGVRSAFTRILKVPSSNIHLMLNGIDTDKFCVRDGQTMRRELGIREDEKTIGCVGNLRPEKNHAFLIRAFRLVLGEIPKARLILVGSHDFPGSSSPALRKLVAELGIADRVMFLGPRDDVERIYPVFDVYCLPSKMEGLPLSPLEAMASGVPVVGTNVTGIREIIRDKGNGFLVPVGDERALAMILSSLLNGMDTTQIRERARLYVREKHSLGKLMRAYERLFK